MKKHIVTHLIIGLDKGGAETMMFQILKYRTENAPQYRIISLGLSGNYYENKILDLGYEVIILNIKRRPIHSLIALAKNLKNTEVLCCWMYYANLIGFIVGKISRVKKIIWCIRHSDLNKRRNSRFVLIVNKICIWLSSKVDVITYNGIESKKIHEQAGYFSKKGIVLENGCDIATFQFNEFLRVKIREKLKIKNDMSMVLSIARNAEIKDLPTFIRAIAAIRQFNDKVIGVMCGNGIEETNHKLVVLCEENKLIIGRDILLIGFFDDINALLSATDLYILHSAGEAFPNTLIQAMACKCLVVTTNVGDASIILNDPEVVVDVGDYHKIAEVSNRLLKLNEWEKGEMRERNRERVVEKYDICNVVRNYEALYGMN